MTAIRFLRRAAAAILGGALLLAGWTARADASEREPGGGLTIAFENDFFAATDRNYSNGAALHYSFAPSDTPNLSYWIGQNLLGANPDAYVRAGLAVGHAIYTPEDTDANPPPPDQHPYAGYLFLRGTLLVDHGDMADSVALDLGIVGPPAGGEWVQNNVHSLIDDDLSRGWDNQIQTEPIVNLSASRRWRVPLLGEEDGLGLDTVPLVSASLGNFRTELAAGGILRFGQQLSADYGPLRVQPSLFAGTLAGKPKPFSWYVYVGVAGHAVAHDITLDGNTFRRSPSVDRKPFVGEWSAGIVVRVYDVKLAYSLVSQTPLYDGGGASQRFGAFNLTIGF